MPVGTTLGPAGALVGAAMLGESVGNKVGDWVTGTSVGVVGM